MAFLKLHANSPLTNCNLAVYKKTDRQRKNKTKLIMNLQKPPGGIKIWHCRFELISSQTRPQTKWKLSIHKQLDSKSHPITARCELFQSNMHVKWDVNWKSAWHLRYRAAAAGRRHKAGFFFLFLQKFGTDCSLTASIYIKKLIFSIQNVERDNEEGRLHTFKLINVYNRNELQESK